MKAVYYAHDHGSGHLRHAANFARLGPCETTVVSGARTIGNADFDFIQLPDDKVANHQQSSTSPFHYTPTSQRSIRERFSALHQVLDDVNPDLVVCDVSAEVVAFATLCGYPVLLRRMHGERSDQAHANAYATAKHLLAYFSKALRQRDPWSLALDTRTTFAGMLPVLDETNLAKRNPDNPRTGLKVVVQTSMGGEGLSLSGLQLAAEQLPSASWMVIGKTTDETINPRISVLGFVDDPLEAMRAADLIITAAGHNALVSAVQSGVPVILFPEKRPFDEQLLLAQSVERETDGAVPVIYDWLQDWPVLITRAMDQDPRSVSKLLFRTDEQFSKALGEAVEKTMNAD